MKDSEGVMVGQHILIKVKKEKKKTPNALSITARI